MDSSISDKIYEIIKDFTSEPAYTKSQMLSEQSQDLFYKMQSELVNAHHILGGVDFVNEDTYKQLDVSAAVSNLETFVQHASAAKELHLILPNHLVAYQERTLSIIKILDKSYKV